MDSIQEQLNSLYNDRDNFQQELNNRGVEATKSDTFTSLVEKLRNMPTGGNLNYKGHVSSVDDLPGPGQPSGTEVAPVFMPEATYSDNWIASPSTAVIDRWNATLQNNNYNYALGIMDATSARPSDAYVLTNYPECIDGIYIGCNLNDVNYFPNCYLIHIKYDANKPVYVLRTSTQFTSSYKYAVMDYDDGTQAISAVSDKLLVTKDGWFYATPFNSNIIGNLPKPLNFKVFPKSTYYTPSSVGNIDSNRFPTVFNTMQISGYNYTDGYKFFKFITGTTQANPASFVTDETDMVENDVYTVGETNEIYHCNSTPAWEHWSVTQSCTNSEIDALFEGDEANE